MTKFLITKFFLIKDLYKQFLPFSIFLYTYSILQYGNNTLNDIIENINHNIITKSLEFKDGEEIYSQTFQNYIKTFLIKENVLTCTFLNYGIINELLQISPQSVMIARRAIVEMMHVLNSNIWQ